MGAVLPAELRDLGNIVFTAGKGEGDQDIQIRKDLSPLLRVQVEVDVIGGQRDRFGRRQLMNETGVFLKETDDIFVFLIRHGRIAMVKRPHDFFGNIPSIKGFVVPVPLIKLTGNLDMPFEGFRRKIEPRI